MRKRLKQILKGFAPMLILALVFSAVALVVAMTQRAAENTVLVCIDAGHGGRDAGALGENQRQEKDDNLRLALAVRDELQTRGIRTILTREDDTFVELEDRCRLANRKKADLFVALHRNSADGGSGTEIWVLSTKPQADTALAESILAQLAAVGISKNRGVRFGLASKEGDYFVNKNTRMPSCLVELGFISSDTDNRLFDENLAAYATAVANGIEQTLTAMSADAAA